ncbi:MAG: HlyD family secretion protein [Devosia sp.]
MDQFLSWLTGLVAIVIPGFGATPEPSWNGYVEADYVYVAAAAPGVIETIAVKEGEAVERGELLFVLRQDQQLALLRAAEARIAVAVANTQNLMTGSRAEEVQVIRASLGKADADLALAEASLARSERLAEQGLTPAAKVDQDRATLASAKAQVAQLQAQLTVAGLPARDPVQAAAAASLLAAQADADKARSDLADRTVIAPVAGRIERLYFGPGEMAAAGVPIAALLPAHALKVKFYVAEADRAGFALSEVVSVSCDGCAEGLTASISYFASDPQFTPPIIYSRDERTRLSFLAEAVLDEAGGLRPGQPVTIRQLE